jgi:glucokinase
VNLARTTVTSPPNFPGWRTQNLSEALRQRLGRDIPILVENDANVAALGSAHFGAGRPYDDFIMVTLGTGVGGAIIVGNKIFRGSTGGAGEIGHMSIDYEGPVARSGVAGAIEAYLGQRFLSRHARDRLIGRPPSLIHELAGDDLRELTPELLYEAAIQGDNAAADIFKWAGHKLGCVLGSAVNLLDIRKIIIGGGQSAAGDLILEPARRSLKQCVTPGLTEGVEIIREMRGNDIAQLGAARLVFDELL